LQDLQREQQAHSETKNELRLLKINYQEQRVRLEHEHASVRLLKIESHAINNTRSPLHLERITPTSVIEQTNRIQQLLTSS
jgi:hypothetical protein